MKLKPKTNKTRTFNKQKQSEFVKHHASGRIIWCYRVRIISQEVIKECLIYKCHLKHLDQRNMHTKYGYCILYSSNASANLLERLLSSGDTNVQKTD